MDGQFQIPCLFFVIRPSALPSPTWRLAYLHSNSMNQSKEPDMDDDDDFESMLAVDAKSCESFRASLASFALVPRQKKSSFLPLFPTSDEVLPIPQSIDTHAGPARISPRKRKLDSFTVKEPRESKTFERKTRAESSNNSAMNGFDKQPMKEKKKRQPRRGYAAPETYAHLDELQDVLADNLDGALRAPYITLCCICSCVPLSSDLLRHKVSMVSFLTKSSSIHIACVYSVTPTNPYAVRAKSQLRSAITSRTRRITFGIAYTSQVTPISSMSQGHFRSYATRLHFRTSPAATGSHSTRKIPARIGKFTQ